jgi:hypothetical protein
MEMDEEGWDRMVEKLNEDVNRNEDPLSLSYLSI